jgi:hypothetical protein
MTDEVLAALAKEEHKQTAREQALIILAPMVSVLSWQALAVRLAKAVLEEEKNRKNEEATCSS